MRALALTAAALGAACDAPAPVALCQAPGELGAGAFAAHDCRDEPGCLDGWSFAAGSVATMIFCPASGQEVTEVVSSDPRVMVTGAPVPLAGDTVTFDLAAGAPGAATIEVRGPALVERLTLTVDALGGLQVTAPARIVEGGRAAITSTKTAGSGAPAFGRGGYEVAAPPALSTRPATTATRACDLDQADVVVTAGAPGSYPVATVAPAPAWSGTIEVVPASAVASARFAATRITGSAAQGYAATVRVSGVDRDGRLLHGVTCAWTSSRPVFIADNVCWSLVFLDDDAPLDLTCSFAGRVLGSVRLTTAIVL